MISSTRYPSPNLCVCARPPVWEREQFPCVSSRRASCLPPSYPYPTSLPSLPPFYSLSNPTPSSDSLPGRCRPHARAVRKKACPTPHPRRHGRPLRRCALQHGARERGGVLGSSLHSPKSRLDRIGRNRADSAGIAPGRLSKSHGAVSMTPLLVRRRPPPRPSQAPSALLGLQRSSRPPCR